MTLKTFIDSLETMKLDIGDGHTNKKFDFLIQILVPQDGKIELYQDRYRKEFNDTYFGSDVYTKKDVLRVETPLNPFFDRAINQISRLTLEKYLFNGWKAIKGEIVLVLD